MKKVLVLILVTGLLITGCGKKDKIAVKELTPVVVEKLEPKPARNLQNYSGIVNAYKNIDLITEVEGVVKKVKVEVGDYVNKGQVLAQVEDIVYLANYERAKSAYDLAKASHERQTALFKETVISQQQFETSAANLKQAYANYLVNKKSLDDCTLRSPIAGTVAVKNFQDGQYAKRGVTAFTIINYDRVKIPFGVTEKDVSKITKGKPAKITIDALPGKSFPGVVTSVGMLADEQTGTYPVEIEVNNANHLLKAGMVANVEVGLDYYPKAKVVTLDTIVTQGETKGIFYLAKNNIVRFKPITVNFEFDKFAKIDGLEYGTYIIIKGQKNIVDGEKVVTTNEEIIE